MFKNFTQFDNKLRSYLKAHDLIEKFEYWRIKGIKNMVDNLDLSQSNDMFQLAYLMWNLVDDFKVLLNDGPYLMSKIDLSIFKSKIMDCTPNLTIKSSPKKLTPLNGPCALLNETLPYYDCIKFIGQYTKSQEVYNQCLDILESIPKGSLGPILNTSEVMCLLCFNEYVNTLHNQYKTFKSEYTLFDKSYQFKHSIYQPEPSQQYHYKRYKKDILLSYYNITKSTDCYSSSYLPIHLCLFNQILINLFTHNDKIEINMIEKCCERLPFTLNNELCIIMNIYLNDINKEDEKEESNILIEDEYNIEDRLRFISGDYDYNDGELHCILSDALIYINDEESLKKNYKKDLLIELYERKIVLPDSKRSHNLIREAAEYGRLWLVKYLIQKGCPTRNLPKYGTWKWNLESRELKDILQEVVKDYNGFGQEWVLKRTTDRQNVLNYLLNNDYI